MPRRLVATCHTDWPNRSHQNPQSRFHYWLHTCVLVSDSSLDMGPRLNLSIQDCLPTREGHGFLLQRHALFSKPIQARVMYCITRSGFGHLASMEEVVFFFLAIIYFFIR